MTPYEAIRAALAGNATIAQAVGDRIRPDRLQAEDGLPAIIIGVRAIVSTEQIAGTDNHRYDAVVECRAASRLQVDQLAEAVRELDGTQLIDGLTTWHIFVGMEDYSAVLAERESDSPDYVAHIDLDLWKLAC